MVAPVDVPVDQREHLTTGALLPPPGVDGLDLHPAEETLRGRVARRTALRARRSRRPEPLHGFRPSRPPMVTAVVGMRRRTRALGQRGGRLLRHGVGGPRVGAVSGCAGDCLAVVAVDHRRGMCLAVRRLGLGDVRQPPLVRTFGVEVPGDQVAGAGVVSPSWEPHLRLPGTCAMSPSPAMIRPITFSETPVPGAALIPRYP